MPTDEDYEYAINTMIDNQQDGYDEQDKANKEFEMNNPEDEDNLYNDE